MAEDLTGGCTCRAVRYRMKRAPMFVNCCHCSWCQRETGSAFVINAIIETTELEITEGATEAVMTPSASGEGQEIHRCPTCRVALFSHYSGTGRASAFVRAGTLDTPGACPPRAHIFTTTRLPWVILPEGVPVFEEYYRLRELWPEDSQRRREAAVAQLASR